VLFAFQGQAILAQPLIIVLLSVPIIIQTYVIFGIGYFANRVVGETHVIAGPSALIGASNFFELAVAVAISLFGFNSGAALATVVGVLIEVPVMLSLVWVVNRSKGLVRHKPGTCPPVRRAAAPIRRLGTIAVEHVKRLHRKPCGQSFTIENELACASERPAHPVQQFSAESGPLWRPYLRAGPFHPDK
jgi:hypothetical protein